MRSHPVRAFCHIAVSIAGSAALPPAAAHAQGTQDKHHLRAVAGNQFHGDSEVDRFDGRAEATWQGGVAGVDPSFFSHHALANGDAGVLAIESTFSLAGGPEDPIFVAGSNTSSASIEESIDPGDLPTGPVTVTARLDWGGSGVLVSPGDVDHGSIRAGLAVNGCSASFRRNFYSTGAVDDDASDSCSQTFYVTSIATAGPAALTVTQIIAEPNALPTRYYVTASIAGEAAPTTSLEYFDSGPYQASAQLSIEVSGVDFSYSSPTFLTVPEPGAAALAAAATAALLALGRRPAQGRGRRGQPLRAVAPAPSLSPTRRSPR